MIPLKSLFLRRGMRIDSALFTRLWNRLLKAIEERTAKKGGGVHLRHGPDGVTIRADTRQSTVVSHPWQMRIDDVSGGWGVRFNRGLLNGVEALIDGELMSAEDAAGETPALFVSPDDFDDRGIARIYARVEWLAPSWVLTTSVELVASAETLPPEPFVCHKLIGILIRDEAGDVVPQQRAYFDLQIVPLDATPEGAALFVPSVES